MKGRKVGCINKRKKGMMHEENKRREKNRIKCTLYTIHYACVMY